MKNQDKDGLVFIHWIHTGNYGGLEKFVLLFHKTLLDKGFNSICVFTKNFPIDKIDQNIHNVFIENKIIFLSTYKKYHPNYIIHYTGKTMHLSLIMFYGDIKHIRIFMHGFKSKLDFFHRFLYKKFNKFIFPTLISYKKGNKFLPVDNKSIFQYFGIKIKEKKIIKEKKYNQGNIIIVSMSRIESKKGIMELVNSFSYAIQNSEIIKKNIILKIFGEPHPHDDEGEYLFNDLKKNILTKKLNKQIQICGYTNEPEIEIQNSNYLIFTSINEFYGFSLIESLGNSTPVITVEKGSFVELNDRTCGMFIDIDDYDETLKFLESLTEIKQKEYLKLCQSAFQSAEEKFNIEKNVNDFMLNLENEK